MKTKTFAAIATVALVVVALPARAGVKVSISLGAPVVFHPPVVVAPPPFLPPVRVVVPPVLPVRALVVAACPPPPPPPCARGMYLPPRHNWYHDRSPHRGWDGPDHGRGHGGPGSCR